MSEIFDRGLPADSLYDEETKSLRFSGDGDLDDVSHHHQTPVGKGGSDSEPLIFSSDDFIGWMVERETEHLPRDDYLMRLKAGELDMGFRVQALDWMIKAYAHHNFGELCLYLAMNYLDRFLSVYDLSGCKAWTVHLVAVACLSLAAKMDEVNVPNTVHIQAGESKFLFEGKTIHRMEILVLNYLKWNIKPYTPLNFVEYFLRKMNHDIEIHSGPLITRSIQIILSTIKGIDFLEFKPSEIAASVAVYVSGEKHAMDIDKALSSFLIVEKGRVMKCLELIRDLISVSGTTCSCSTTITTTSSSKTANVATSSILSTWFCHSPNGVLDAACVSYKSDERRGGSCSTSFENSPDKKRRKLDHGTDLGA